MTPVGAGMRGLWRLCHTTQTNRFILPGWGHPAQHHGGVVMKAIHWIIAAAALLSAQPAQAGVNDPEVIIYRFSGLFDNGGADFQGVATVFHCTNFSGVDE